MDKKVITPAKRSESPLSSLVAGTSPLMGEAFFQTFIQHLAEAYGAEYATASELISDDPLKVRTLAFWGDGELQENVEYEVKTTPCECVYRDGLSYFPNSIQSIFEEDEDLVNMGVHSYYGAPMVASSGEVIGHICVLGKEALAETDFAEEYFRIFSARASSELQRIKLEREMEQHRENLKTLVDEQVLLIRKANKETEVANEAKSNFLSRMGHELKTPMNAILGFSEVLELDKEMFTADQQESISAIINSGWQLNNVISEILDITKSESGDIETNLVECDIRALIDKCIDLMTSKTKITNIEIGYADDAADSAMVMADERRLKQVIVNLLSNAVKFNRKNGKVTINISLLEGGRTQVDITDTGPGISDDGQTKIFEKFERLNSDEECIEGTGLGLAITKRLVEHMGGTIGVESTVGEGSRFWVEFGAVNI